MSFVHLHRHSEFSRLDGLGTAKQYADRAADLGQGSIALTDHGTLSGALHHIKACRKAKILPIMGVEAYFRPDRALAKKFKQREAFHLCLFAKNLRGWHSLLRVISTAFQDIEDGGGFYQYPCVDWELLKKNSDGLVASSACVSSYLSSLILGEDDQAVRDYLWQMRSIFGDDFWLEIMPHDFDDQAYINLILLDLAREFSIPVIATNDAHFPYKEWAETQRIAKLAGSGSSFKKWQEDIEKGKNNYLGELHPSLYLCSEGDMREWFRRNHPMIRKEVSEEAISNTSLFASKITPFMLDKTDKLPRAAAQEGEELDPEKKLRQWIEEGLDRIFSEYPETHWERWPKQVYRDRVDTELGVLKKKGVIPYMVLVGDICRWCRSQKIPVNCRGSAAGCLISYLIGIVAIDPISWGLLFERFLNPDRKGLPDIDIDVASDRRAEVKKRVQTQKWCEECGIDHDGADHVADIITHQRFQPKSVIQTVCRVFDLPYMESHAVTDTIEIRQDSEETTLEEILPLNPKLQQWKAAHPDLWEHCLRLEHTVQNAGKHAAGIVITPKPVMHYMALERGKKGDLVTSWSDAADFTAVSDHGFVKIDCLGLKGLARQQYALSLIKKRTGKEIDLYKLGPLRNPYDTEDAVLEGFRNGWTIGVFQFGGRGITGLIKDIAPDLCFDLAAANALYRPGPMKGEVTWDYAKRKRGDQEVTYWHPLVEPVLEETYGLIAYQEQVMEICKQLGGFTGAEADDMRKAMGKLYRIKGGAAKEFMSQFETKWYEGCTNRGIDSKAADEIWHKLLEFGHYGFNKSHSATYAVQAYQDMWLKVFYPLEFYASLLTFEDDDDKKLQAIREARSRGLEILPPSVQTSNIGWTVDVESLRMGLLAIKGVGEKGAAMIVTKRAGGDYESVEDFRARVPAKSINAKAMEALEESGAFDCFGVRDQWTDKAIQKAEKERLGMSLTIAGSLEKYAQYLRDNIYTQDECDSYAPGTSVIVGGEIMKFERKLTKKGSPFANCTIVFEMNEWRVKFWSEALAQYEHMLEVGNAVMVSGKTDEYNGFVSVVARDVTDQFDKMEA